ncbi:MAG: 5'/3'-nucleotidase SurE [Candidatus Rokuibacteriota bacterium]
MRILISNDDGIEALGLELLVDAASRVSADVWVVAPDGNRSSVGHAITMRRPFSITEVSDQRFSCSGTPADCVIVALAWVFAGEPKPDLVLAGINDGLNVAEDIAYSGTIAVAREAAFWGIPAISVSRPKALGRYGPSQLDWLARLLGHFWTARSGWAREGHWLNVNLPETVPAPVREADVGRDKIAREVAVVHRNGAHTTLQTLAGRYATAGDGDENSLTRAGYACVTNLHWFGTARLSPEILPSLNSATVERRGGVA